MADDGGADTVRPKRVQGRVMAIAATLAIRSRHNICSSWSQDTQFSQAEDPILDASGPFIRVMLSVSMLSNECAS